MSSEKGFFDSLITDLNQAQTKSYHVIGALSLIVITSWVLIIWGSIWVYQNKNYMDEGNNSNKNKYNGGIAMIVIGVGLLLINGFFGKKLADDYLKL